MEEAGAVLIGELRCYSAHVADSARAKPYRPHLPHPRAYWVYAVVRVRVIGAPTNPVGGEQVVEVLTLPPSVGADLLHDEDPIHADVLRHADALDLVRGTA